jgi:phosphomannomutase
MTAEEAIAAARAWIAADPDEATRRELQSYIDEGRHALLVEVMSGSLEFGTAGLRAVVGPGPQRMNRAVVRRTTAGVARYLTHTGGAPAGVVVACDARLSSAAFQREVIGVLAAHGIPVRYFPSPIATPIAAYVARRLRAAAAIVITASHNPAEYNGYKLYGANAVQIVPPVDGQIALEIERSAPAAEEPCLDWAAAAAAPGVAPVPENLLADYFREVAALAPPPATGGAPYRELSIVYTPMHGVGWWPLERVLRDAGFSNVHVVAAQRDPDGHFPTTRFPNPEEPGALALATELARSVAADLILANDPDVDRLAASVPDGRGSWVALTGNQIGTLLADLVLEHAAPSPRPLVIQSVVSSPLLRDQAAAAGARLEQTLTGFKWIWTAALALTQDGSHAFVFGYEEALGYSVGQLVRDKDGISSALLLAELAALERARGSSLRQRLERIYHRHGVWTSVQRSVTRAGLQGQREIAAAMDGVAQRPPLNIAGVPVTRVTDFRSGGERRPPWLENTSLIELTLGDRGRLLVRPSGTEPKLKVYVDLTRRPGAGADVWATERELRAEAEALAAALVSELGLA